MTPVKVLLNSTVAKNQFVKFFTEHRKYLIKFKVKKYCFENALSSLRVNFIFILELVMLIGAQQATSYYKLKAKVIFPLMYK